MVKGQYEYMTVQLQLTVSLEQMIHFPYSTVFIRHFHITLTRGKILFSSYVDIAYPATRAVLCYHAGTGLYSTCLLFPVVRLCFRHLNHKIES